jgi:putative Holliday junction resolvase
MADLNENDLFEGETYTLTDEEGNESVFELIGSCEMDGVTYLALVPEEEGEDEYVILKKELDANGEDSIVTIDNDEEFDKVADYFEDELFAEIDYDDIVDEDDESN